jgi:ABC-2 type transport system permease protein
MNAYVLNDSATMLRRSLRRMRRYPSLTFFIAGLPVVLLLLFVYVFGGALGAGLGTPGTTIGLGDSAAGREAYIAYVIPGIFLMTVVGVGQGTAITVAMDMTAGIVARFRTMAIARTAVLAGHVIGSVIQAGLALVAFAVSWLSVAMGMATGSVETASNLPMILILFLFLSSAFVPTASMPDPLRWFAEHQPFTPITETLRSLLFGAPLGDNGVVALAWCVAVSILAALWARRLYERSPVRAPA